MYFILYVRAHTCYGRCIRACVKSLDVSGGSGDTDLNCWELKGWLEELLMPWTDGQRTASWWGLQGVLRPIRDGAGADGVSKVNQGPCGTSGGLF